MKNKIRLDSLLVKKNIIQSRQKAKSMIMAGLVLVNGERCDKAGTQFNEYVHIKIKESSIKYVSRGGLKLEAILKNNKINCLEAICLDVGASTGGFTDCLLQNGAKKIFAVDVGYGQIAWKLRLDPRVIVFERINIRYMPCSLITDPIDIITIDVSFISLKIVIPSILQYLRKGGIIIALIKPQFEVGKNNVGKKGIIKSTFLHEKVIKNLKNFSREIGFTHGDVIESPLLGSKGNKEFLITLYK